MRLLHRLFFSLALALMFFQMAGAQGATFTVQIKASPTREEAEEEVRQLKARNISAYIVKSIVQGKGVFYRVRAGVFSTRNDASKFGSNLQQRGVIPEFIVMPYEKPIEDVASNPAPAATSRPKTPPRASQPDPDNSAGETRAAVQPRTERAPINSAPSEASNPAPAAASKPTTGAAANSPVRSTPTTANNPGLSASVEAPASKAPASAPPSGFARYRDEKVGYSFDYPEYWTGQPLTDKEATEQRMNAGAMFSSQKDSAFLSVIWNELDKANNLSNENDLIVDVILRSMSASEGISKLEETARRVENRDGLIKTYLELKAVLQTPEQTSPLDFLGKAVIVRASRGILLVATFYAKDSGPNVSSSIDKIIASARAPE
ncbi:MAG TPA: SPOR domain-containing protein [Blastocatellia bacterium]|nr:SPOR domain-containing protein [Blastocatellia bacterium]